MATPSSILKLSNELLREILDHIEADPEKLVNLDRREYLSQESFKAPPPPTHDQAQDIGHFRLTCTRFSQLGVVHQFARVTTRFSKKGFKRLEDIAGQIHLSKHVMKFSYMVPYFFVEGRENVRELLPNFQESLGALDIRNFVEKSNEQKDIVRTEEDARVLRRALSAFTSLQHVQLLRVQDRADSILLGYIREHDNLARIVDLKWAPACSRSTKTIGAALIASRSPCSRFSSPMLSPQSAGVLAGRTPQTLKILAQGLTSLELHFDDGTDLDNRILDLSTLFKTVFMAAENMQSIHLGFPSHRPLSLRLEDLFHHVKWERLSAFGIQGWKLDAEEIIALVGRHRERLRGLRLRDVLLNDGSMWKDVLGFLRHDMVRLDWVSLRRIDYAKHFDEQWAVAGAEVPDDPPGGASDSEEESGEGSNSEPPVDGFRTPPNATESESDVSDADISDGHSEHDDDHGPQANEMYFPQLSPDTPSPVVRYTRQISDGLYPDNMEDIGDDGIFVSNTQRKFWEKWVVKRYGERGSRR